MKKNETSESDFYAARASEEENARNMNLERFGEILKGGERS